MRLRAGGDGREMGESQVLSVVGSSGTPASLSLSLSVGAQRSDGGVGGLGRELKIDGNVSS